MQDYTLYYWPIPFRGQFVRSVLAHVGATWHEPSMDELVGLKNADPADQPVPHMGPPVLIDHKADLAFSQTQAILSYLSGKYGLTPDTPEAMATTAKVIADANDVLYEMTLHNGAAMWTDERWQEYQPRLQRWMTFFEVLGKRHGLSVEGGTFLGTDTPTLADLVIACLWGVMTDKLPPLRPILNESAPAIAALTDRIGALPEQVELRLESDQAYGNGWCSGQIEASLRAVLHC